LIIGGGLVATFLGHPAGTTYV